MINNISGRADRVVYDKPRQTGPLTAEDIEQRALNREIMKRLDFKAVKSSMAEGRRRFTDSQILSNNKYEGIEVNISEDYGKWLTVANCEDIDATARKRYEDFFDDPSYFHSQPLSEWAFDFANRVSALGLSHSISFLLGGGDATEETRMIVEYGGQLFGTIDDHNYGHKMETDVINFTNLANKYSEIRQSLEGQYSGEELEKQLKFLSDAFDLAVEVYSTNRANGMRNKLVLEQHKIAIHNQMVKQGLPGLFEGGVIEIDKDELRNIINKITDGTKEWASYSAHMAKQFVLENGLIDSHEREAELLAYLMDAEPPKGGFSFKEWGSINEVYKKTSAFYQENEPKDGDPFPRQLPLRNETMFSELKRLLSW